MRRLKDIFLKWQTMYHTIIVSRACQMLAYIAEPGVQCEQEPVISSLLEWDKEC